MEYNNTRNVGLERITLCLETNSAEIIISIYILLNITTLSVLTAP